jgi:sigma-B regulation protein RsbU (phosphoserine phosphatase)
LIEAIKYSKDQHYKKQLYSLLQVTRAINNNFPASDLFSIFEFILKQQLGYTKFAYCSFDEIWRWQVSYGATNETRLIKPEIDLLQFEELTFIDENSPENLRNFNVVIPVYHKKHALAFLLMGDLDELSLEIARTLDLEFVETISNVISVAIENKRLFKDNVQQEMYKREMEMAKEVQNMLIPSSLPNDEFFDFAAFYQPQRHIGGDYYDFISVNEDEVIFCVADVSGKGVAAALLMANFQAYLHALVGITTDLKKIIQDLNNRVVESAKGEKFITMFIARYNKISRKLNYVNAGHNPPILTSQNESILLKEGTTGLGMLEKLFRLEEGEVEVAKNSRLLCYTDGLVEQENEGGVDFGIEQLELIMHQNKACNSEDFNRILLDYLITYKGDQPYIDDIALLTCRFF